MGVAGLGRTAARARAAGARSAARGREPAPPAADVGANDDTGKYAADAGAAFYAEMASLGLRQVVVTVRWQPSDPLGARASGRCST